MENILKLRAHHLLCTALYEGKGYSKEFTDNMTEVVNRLKRGTNVELQVTPDIICSACPNALTNGKCALDKSEEDDISCMDSIILGGLKLKTENIYDSKELRNYVKENITDELFNKCCGECRWKKEGLCSVEGIKNSVI